MMTRSTVRSILVALAFVGISLSANEVVGGDLKRGFVNPPDAAKPRVYWWWLNSNISKAGITRDLEAMRRKGIGGAMVFDAGGPAGPTPPGPRFMGPAWRAAFKHAVAEADRLGLEISLNLCSGWDSGGPWVTPEHACQKVVWSEITVEGPCDLSQVLPIPVGVSRHPDGRPVYYQDIAVQAFDARASRSGSMILASPKATASSRWWNHAPQHAVDGDPTTFWASDGYPSGNGSENDASQWLLLAFKEAYEAASLYVVPGVDRGPRKCELQSSENGDVFQTVTRFTVPKGKATTVTFNQVRSRFFRVLITAVHPAGSKRYPRSVQIAEMQLLGAGETRKERFPIKHWRLKSGNTGVWLGHWTATSRGAPYERNADVAGDVYIDRASLVDLSRNINASGHLTWKVPPGKWSILRIGHTLTGRRVSTHSPGGGGYMLDYLSTAAMNLQFDAIATKVLEDIGPLAGKGLKYFHDDSWEVGSPNWTVRFRDEFKRRRGYDLLGYLPVLAGCVVDSRDVSNRFLWDFRRTIGDCIAENHYGTLRDLSRRHGIGIHPESGGPFFPHIDALQCLGKGDIPMGEFWAREYKPAELIPWRNMHHVCDIIKQAASAAHIYGKRDVQAEAFTTIGPHWEKSPFDLKDIGDHAFCQGLTRVMFHTFTHSPTEAGTPGIEYFAGTHFNPNITWWEQADAWTGYIARCQFLLRQGLFVADACYYYGEGVPNFVPGKRMMRPALPFGYDHDVTNAEVLLTRMSVADGRIVLPDGMSYRLLVLPEERPMSPEVLGKITELVAAGATVVGPKPTGAPGLRNYPHADGIVKKMAETLWGNVDGKAIQERTYGKGSILWGRPLQDILRADGISADFELTARRKDANFDYIHRTSDDAEIYFVSNQNNRWEDVECEFRVSGKVPELWMPATGEMREQVVYDIVEGRTKMPLRLAPRGSVFVVFRKPVQESPVRSVTKEGKPVLPGPGGDLPHIELLTRQGREVTLRVWRVGRYELETADGKRAVIEVANVPQPRKISGPWKLTFPQDWGAPPETTLDKLVAWNEHPAEGIRYFSGTATYHNSFNLEAGLLGNPLILDLGRLKNFAEVRLNGKDLGVLWKPPFRVDIRGAVRQGKNTLEIKITNLWPNRLIGDAKLPEGKRFTKTNVQKFNQPPKRGRHVLLESGLLGPVRILAPVRAKAMF